MQRVHSLLVVSFLLCANALFAGNTPTLAVADSKVVDEARSIAEKYWNAQKTSDVDLFRSVTPHTNMNVVFAWTFVRDSGILVEEGDIEGFRQDLRSFVVSYQKFKSKNVLKDIEEAAKSAKKVGILHPFLGEFLQKGYWDTITPPNFADSKNYKLMGYEYIVDVEFQSRAGATLKKRVTTILRRFVVDDYDSGWKVFYIPGS